MEKDKIWGQAEYFKTRTFKISDEVFEDIKQIHDFTGETYNQLFKKLVELYKNEEGNR